MFKNWRAISEKTAIEHSTRGASLTAPDREGEPSEFQYEGFPLLQIPGPRLDPVRIRQWLFDHRKQAAKAHLLWSLYDERTNTSILGMGVFP